jgi:hypothetical protein
MSDDETPPVSGSGSRWEPADGDEQAPVAPPAYAPAPTPRNRGRLVLAGGAVGLALVAGTGGFALGHATANDGRDGRFGGPGFRQGGFPNQLGPNQQGPGGGLPGFGNQPPGQFPQDPRDDDGRDGVPDDQSSSAPDTSGSHT